MAVVAESRLWLGTPFHHQGRVLGVGVDCIGLLIGIGRTLGLCAPDFDIKGYAPIPDGKTLVAQADSFMQRIDRDSMGVGDVIVIRWGADPQHVGLIGDYVHGGHSLIHAYGETDGSGSVIEHHLGPHHLKRFVAAYRLPGVEAAL